MKLGLHTGSSTSFDAYLSVLHHAATNQTNHKAMKLLNDDLHE